MQTVMYISDLVNKINQSKILKPEYRFKLDMVHSSIPVYEEGEKLPCIEYIGKADSILKDITIVPSDLIIPVCSRKENLKIVRWINERIFTSILQDLLEEKLTEFNTRFVRVAIASSMITDKSVLITKEERIEWQIHFKDVFYNRCLAINDYYSRDIIQLPF